MNHTGMMGRKTRIVERETLIPLLQAALTSGELRFARQVAYAWLAAFPGDLEVRLLQARVLFAGEHPAQAVPVLEQLVQKDPEYCAAHEMLMRVARTSSPDRARLAANHAFILGGKTRMDAVLPGCDAMRAAYRALVEKQWAELGHLLPEVDEAFPDMVLGAILRFGWVQAMQAPSEAQRLAKIYHDRWPECLQFQLALAAARIELGQEEEGVELLHQCAGSDATGQVARRLWGEGHAYRGLWPEQLLIPFDFAIPAAVAGRMGWNQLGPGQKVEEASSLAAARPTVEPDLPAVEDRETAAKPSEPGDQKPEAQKSAMVGDMYMAEAAEPLEDRVEAAFPETVAEGSGWAEGSDAKAPRRRKARVDGVLKEVEVEFERLAKKLKQPELAREDGRYPVYVIFTTRNGLVAQYGVQTVNVLDQELRRLATLVSQRPGWDALVFYADDAACTERFGLTPVPGDDPWKLKLLLSDLDRALFHRGEMIGAVLIVGGDTIIPFHRLPNPTDDADRVVPSDSPYGTLDANYFVPDWPVGRLPGEPGPDVTYLLERIRKLQKYHGRVSEKSRRRRHWLDWLPWGWLRKNPPQQAHGLGYTAAVWRRSSMAVFRTIGSPHTLVTSPPENSGSLDPEWLGAAGLGYYNLHGVEDSESWYGQSDPIEHPNGPDYPVALSPKDLRRNGKAPKVVFSEACYGGHIFGKREEQSLALKFLGVGALAVVASTCVSYGSISTPLIAADLLGSLFWKHLKAGRTAGESLVQARVDLAREMNRRQGYLDGEDQKALISFVLFGDPLASYQGFQVHSKGARRLKNAPAFKTVSEQEIVGVQVSASEILKQAKSLAAEYLPGAGLAGEDGLDVSLCRQNRTAPEKSKGAQVAPTRANLARANLAQEGRLVVTVSKQVRVAQHLHRHYVRVTLDEGGKPVKLTVSR